MPTDQLTGHQHSLRQLVSAIPVISLCRQINPQNFRHIRWSFWSGRIAAPCRSPESSVRIILLVPDNQDRFLVTIYHLKGDFALRKCTGGASGPEESKLLQVYLSCAGRTLRRTSEWRTEFVFCFCELPRTSFDNIGVLCFYYLVTVICPNILSKLKCRTRDLRTLSDVLALWFSSSKHAVTLLESHSATVNVVLGGLFEAVTLDPSNFSLFSFRPPAMDLTTAYRYNQNMMEYYTCKSKS